MQPKDTIWELDPQTVGKHHVLRNYLDAWLPIMGSTNSRILFIDGFAGPGVYKGGEDGSPVVALKALCNHRSKDKISAEVGFIFIEKQDDRFNHLQSIVDIWRRELPPKCWIETHHGIFDETMASAFKQLEDRSAQLAPAFVMIDPFGVSDTPMKVVHRILKNRRCEVYISFMYDFMNRFKEHPSFQPHLDELFGCPTWRECVEIVDPQESRERLFSIYEQQLRSGGAQYVLHFELYRENRLIYSIFFGTQNLIGCQRMKEAIWKIAPWGDFAFRGTKSQQMSFGLAAPDFRPLVTAIKTEFAGKGWLLVKDIEDFVASDKTDYLPSHIRKNVLTPMAQAGELEVDERTRIKKGAFPPQTRLCIF